MATEWDIIFYVVAGIYVAGAIFYFLFASGEKQPWANQGLRVGLGPKSLGLLGEGSETDENVGMKDGAGYGSNYVH